MTSIAPAERQRRIVLLGTRAVGKSSLALRYVHHTFPTAYDPTIQHAYTHPVRHGRATYLLEIIDTAGHDEFSMLQSSYALGVNGYVLVYSVASRNSWDMVRVLRDKVLDLVGVDWVPMVIVGNKRDLAKGDAGARKRQVSAEEASAQAAEWRCGWIETSAKENENVERVFDAMLEEIERLERGKDGGADAPATDGKSGCMVM